MGVWRWYFHACLLPVVAQPMHGSCPRASRVVWVSNGGSAPPCLYVLTPLRPLQCCLPRFKAYLLTHTSVARTQRCAVGGDRLVLLPALLRARGCLSALLLDRCSLDAAGVRVLADLLRSPDVPLARLELRQCKLPGGHGASRLAAAVKDARHLQTLNLAGSGLGKHSAAALAAGLLRRPVASSARPVGGSAAESSDYARNVAPMSPMSPTSPMSPLSPMSPVSPLSPGAAACGATAPSAPSPPTLLRHLNLAANKIGADGGAALAEALRCPSLPLQRIVLSRKQLGSEGAKAIVDAMIARAGLLVAPPNGSMAEVGLSFVSGISDGEGPAVVPPAQPESGDSATSSAASWVAALPSAPPGLPPLPSLRTRPLPLSVGAGASGEGGAGLPFTTNSSSPMAAALQALRQRLQGGARGLLRGGSLDSSDSEALRELSSGTWRPHNAGTQHDESAAPPLSLAPSSQSAGTAVPSSAASHASAPSSSAAVAATAPSATAASQHSLRWSIRRPSVRHGRSSSSGGAAPMGVPSMPPAMQPVVGLSLSCLSQAPQVRLLMCPSYIPAYFYDCHEDDDLC